MTPALRVLICFLGTALTLAVAPRVWADAPEPRDRVTLQLKWYHQFQFAGYYAAQAKGFYEAEGLDVHILEGDDQHPPIRQVLAGQAEFGVSDADLLLAYLEGKPLVALAAVFQHSPYILMTRADSGIRTPTHLRGKTIMLEDEQGIAQIKAMFRREGMSLDAVHIVPHTWNNQDLIEGRVAAISAYSTVEPYQLRQKGVEPGMIRAMDYGVDFYGDTLFTTRRQIEDYPERVAAFRRASLKGWDYAMAHPDEMIDLIVQMPGVTERGITRDLLKFEADAMHELIVPDLVDLGHMNPGRWEAMARVYADVGVIPRTPKSLEPFIFDPDAPKPNRWLVPAMIALGVAVVGGGGILLWNLHLKRVVAHRTAELQRSEALFRTTLENLDQSVVVSDLNGHLLLWNRAALEMHGFTDASQALGPASAHAADMELSTMDGQVLSVDEWPLYRVLRGERVRDMHLRVHHRQGWERMFSYSGSLVRDDKGNPLMAVIMPSDITDRLRAEMEMQAARQSAEQAKAEAEDANRAKDKFLAVLSHELRTPLTPVLASVSLLQKTSYSDGSTRHALEVIRRNVELEARLIDDLLDLTRIARGKVELNKQPVPLCTVIQRAIEVCKPDIEARRIEFGVDIGPDAPYYVEADVARLQQVFWNLLKNSIKFTPHGGCIGVRCRREQGEVVAEVNDSGAGIEPEALPRIFDAFAQADRAVTRQFGGLGLGLAISKSILEMHDGKIEATSPGKGRGATFTIRLPLLALHHAGDLSGPVAEPASPTGSDTQTLRVLVVEDHGDTAEMMRIMLESKGHDVQTAGDVATALQTVVRQEFDLLISDLGLPDGSGLDLIRELRARGHLFPSIALSGYGQDNDIQQSRAAGFAAHLTKPVDVDKLLSTIDQIASVVAR